MILFQCDYNEGAHPKVMEKLMETNLEQTSGYGNDAHTDRARRLILEACGLTPEQGRVHFLVGGTQTNATVIDGLLRRHEGVLAAETAHINVHESGAIEASGHKVLTLPSHNGKLLAAEVEVYIRAFYRDDTYEHMVAPGAVYISHPTELGTLYTLSELQDLSRVCREAGIPLYVDGARLGYGLVAEGAGVTLKDLARCADVFYVGGTKVGALFGEAVVVTRPELLLRDKQMMLDHLGQRLSHGLRACLGTERERYARMAASLDALSPFKVLSRGYAIPQRADGGVAVSAREYAPGDHLTLTMADGSLDCRVEESRCRTWRKKR